MKWKVECKILTGVEGGQGLVPLTPALLKGHLYWLISSSCQFSRFIDSLLRDVIYLVFRSLQTLCAMFSTKWWIVSSISLKCTVLYVCILRHLFFFFFLNAVSLLLIRKWQHIEGSYKCLAMTVAGLLPFSFQSHGPWLSFLKYLDTL